MLEVCSTSRKKKHCLAESKHSDLLRMYMEGLTCLDNEYKLNQVGSQETLPSLLSQSPKLKTRKPFLVSLCLTHLSTSFTYSASKLYPQIIFLSYPTAATLCSPTTITYFGTLESQETCPGQVAYTPIQCVHDASINFLNHWLNKSGISVGIYMCGLFHSLASLIQT